MLHKEILSSEQEEIFAFLKNFHKNFVLCGGTAIALHLGHRRSIDFDFFTTQEFDIDVIRRKLLAVDKRFVVLVRSDTEYTVVVRGVKITFLQFPFPFEGTVPLDDVLVLADLLTLAAMKAYALGRRSKWKDYIDLYLILSQHYSLQEVVTKAETMFGKEFNEKIFRAALAYFEDIDFSEEVSFLPGFEVEDEYIRLKLQELSVTE
jgi:hypothetical protein